MVDSQEQWRLITGGNYEISSHGRFRRATPGRRTFAGRLISPIKMKIGYFMVQPTVNGKNVKFYIHHLVAEAFIGPRPDGLSINHKDGDKTNNQVENLEYVTHKENIQHASRIGLMNVMKTMTKEKIEEIRSLRASGMSFSKISKSTGVSVGWCWQYTNGRKKGE